MTGEAVRIAMWSGPRNISTTVMRAFENRPDTVVFDEPFYGAYLKASGAAHPYREETLAAQPSNIGAALEELAAPLPEGARIGFQKHIAFHYPDDEPIEWLLSTRTFLLIRDPERMVASYAMKFDDVQPVIDSFRIERRIHDFLTANEIACPILDAADILADPEGSLRALCAALDIPFTDKMLSWPAGPRASDGVWAPHWYDAVTASTGFKAPPEKPVELDPRLKQIAKACADDYAFLHTRRLRAQRLGEIESSA